MGVQNQTRAETKSPAAKARSVYMVAGVITYRDLDGSLHKEIIEYDFPALYRIGDMWIAVTESDDYIVYGRNLKDVIVTSNDGFDDIDVVIVAKRSPFRNAFREGLWPLE